MRAKSSAWTRSKFGLRLIPITAEEIPMTEVRKTCCGTIIAEDESAQLTSEYRGKTYYF